MSDGSADNAKPTAKPAARSNPYTLKKVAPNNLYRKPLEEFDNFEDEQPPPMTTTKNNQHQNLKQKQPTENVMRSNNENGDAMETTTVENITPVANTPQQPMSVNLPLWKRLPSRTISLSPAEILTIAEVCRCGHFYDNKAIRITGVLAHRMRHLETGEVSLVLEDPLTKLSSNSSNNNNISHSKRYGAAVSATAAGSRKKEIGAGDSSRKSSSLKSRRISFGITNKTSASMAAAADDSTNNAKPAASATKQRPRLGMARNRTTPLISRSGGGGVGGSTPAASRRGQGSGIKSAFKHTPLASKLAPTTPRTGLVSKRTSGSTSALFRTPGALGSTRKRSLPSSCSTKTPPKTNEEIVANAILGETGSTGKQTVWIVADPRFVSIDTLALGDIVTVMGAVQMYQQTNEYDPISTQQTTYRTEDDDDNPSSPRRADAHTSSRQRFSAGIRQMGNLIWKEQQQRNTNPSLKDTLFLQARIVRQDNGANLRLHLEALQLRRDHILSNYHPAAVKDGSPTVLLGCGPPPYNLSASD